MARPPIPIEPYIDKLCQAMLMGATYELAALYAGISADTFARWRQRAATARPGTPLVRLRDRLTEAEGQAALRWLAQIQAAAAEDWRAAAYMLERRYPEMYGKQVLEQCHSGEVDHTVRVLVHRYGQPSPHE
jgi:hypothetical protein